MLAVVGPVREFQSAPVFAPLAELEPSPLPSVKSLSRGRSCRVLMVPLPVEAAQRSKDALVMVALAGTPARSKAKSPRMPVLLLRPMRSWSRAPEFQVGLSPRMKVAAWV